MESGPRPSPTAVALALLAVLAGCGSPDGTPESLSGITVVDASGAERTLPAPARRIVSLVPSATLTLRALGEEGRLVGRTDYDLAEWVASVPSVGGGLQPSLEEIVLLEPDLVIRFEGQQDTRTPARLDDVGIPHVAIRPDAVEDVYEAIELIGALTGATGAADSLVAHIRSELAALEAAVAALPRLDVAYVMGGTPPWVAGPGTYVEQVLAIAGGDNVFSDLDALYAAVSPEELLARQIDAVIVPGGSSFAPEMSPRARVVEIGDALELPGPGVAAAAWRVAELLHGRTLR